MESLRPVHSWVPQELGGIWGTIPTPPQESVPGGSTLEYAIHALSLGYLTLIYLMFPFNPL